MSKNKLAIAINGAVLGTVILSGASNAIASPPNTSTTLEVAQLTEAEFDSLLLDEQQTSDEDAMDQVTNINQLRDVSPGDWAYEALASLVNRYGCIVGYPNQTYRGNQALTRYEFAAGLNSCLNVIERLIVEGGGGVAAEDLERIQRLVFEFEAELATLGARVDDLEGRTAFLEDNQFSTTTKLTGEVAFTLADAFGDTRADGTGEDLDVETVFTDKVRLQLATTFTGEDVLYTRLTAGNIDNSFQDEIGTLEGRFAHDGPAGNNIIIDRLHYVFPVGANLKVTTMAGLGAHHFYTEVFNSNLNTGGGATGALSRFGERSPIYRLGIGRLTTGVGFTYDFGDKIEISAGYLAPSGSDPNEERGLFNGSYSALGQIALLPTEDIKIGLTYVHGYKTFNWGGTGTSFANNLNLSDPANTPVVTNTYGAEFQWDLSPKLSLRGWFAYSNLDILELNGDGEVWTYAAALAFPDLGKEGNLGAVIVGSEPYLGFVKGDGIDSDIPNDTPIHVEALYRYQINDRISITPGLIWLVNPNQNEDNDDVFIGALRTTFQF